MRKFILASVLLLTGLAAAETWDKTYKVGAAPQLTVETSDASVEVHAASDGQMVARVTSSEVRLTGPDADAHISESQSGDNVFLSVREHSGVHFCLFCNRSLRVSVDVPAGTKLTIRTSDGSLHVYNVKGPADLRTSDGSIEVQNHDGILRAHTSDGSIRASGRFEQLSLDTSDGSINCEIARGSKLTTDWKVRTGDGSVRLRVPDDLSANLRLSTGDGSIHSDVPLDGVQGPISKRAMTGKLHGGGNMLEVHTGDGSIHLSQL